MTTANALLASPKPGMAVLVEVGGGQLYMGLTIGHLSGPIRVLLLEIRADGLLLGDAGWLRSGRRGRSRCG
jgi:hypothetical protein